VLHVLANRHDRLLDDVLGFGVREARFDRHSVNQFPIGVEELAPTLLVVPVLQPFDQGPTRRKQFIRIILHKRIEFLLSYTDTNRPFFHGSPMPRRWRPSLPGLPQGMFGVLKEWKMTGPGRI